MSALSPDLPRLCEATIPAMRPDGTMRDLGRPDPRDVDFAEMAVALARLPRFAGATPGLHAYSVAQHSVLGTEALLNEGADSFTALLFLLHDGHEWLLGDITRPQMLLIGECMAEVKRGLAASALDDAILFIKAGWDAAIYGAAGLPAPSAWTKRQAQEVERMDSRMLAVERLDLFGQAVTGRHERPRFRGTIQPWPAARAELAFTETLERLSGITTRTITRGRRA